MNTSLVSSLVARIPSDLGATLAVPPTYMAFSLSRATTPGATATASRSMAATRRRIRLLLGSPRITLRKSRLHETQAVLIAAVDLGDPADLRVVVAPRVG